MILKPQQHVVEMTVQLQNFKMKLLPGSILDAFFFHLICKDKASGEDAGEMMAQQLKALAAYSESGFDF